ncbi:aminotransferase-like domain-containing protein [Metabacillus arenae]|uniref:PLP-dependent aminotransferase family protein n=1 Tax=Metabacillus arenae TaxID=2771434 RepID=A0A926NI52_9BACI|nr:PLP-dependent aminotransferase family protein [Metabacillus arenae]MBD1381761.1 PLP-dependent aminotransferase family protein [Metabacillus arenae]
MKYPFAKRVRHLQSSAVRDILKVVNKGNVISFAGGLPDDELFPNEAIKEAFSRVFAKGNNPLQYIETEGYGPLREVILDRMAKKQISGFNTGQVLLTTGSQQAIDLFSRVMFNPGDIILTEDPTYLAALQVFESYEAHVVAVDSDQYGMIPEDLERKMKRYRPKCVYVVPTFSNPSGRVWSFERRQHLINMAHKHHVMVLEDDPYGDIQFNTDDVNIPLAALDDGTHVIYTSTFSKTAAPALRTGWIAGPHQIIRIMSQAKQANDLHSNSLSHQALHELCCHFDLDSHIRKISEVYGHRMNIMVDKLLKADIQDLSFVKPKGGMFLWLELDPQTDTASLLTEAVSRGVAYVPGEPFYAGTPKRNAMRLNFTHSTPEKIEKGIELLTDLLQDTNNKEFILQ